MNNYEIQPSRIDASSDGAGPSSGHQPANVFALRNVLRVLRRRRGWIVGVLVVFVALAFAITAVMRPTYEATATIELNKSSGESLDLGIGDSLGQQANSGGEGLLTDLQTETAILQGDSLALAVIEKLGLAKQAPFAAKVDREAAEAGLPLEEAPLTRTRLLKVFSTHLQVQPARGTRLIRVTFSSHDPKQAAEIANALIDSYKSQYLQSHYEASSDASNWLTKQLSELKSNVEDSEKKLTDFEKESGILSLQTGGGGDADNKGEIHSVVIQKLDALNSELTAAEANRIQKEAIYHIVKGGDTDAVLAMSNNPLAEAKSLVFTEGGGTANLERLKEQQDQLKLTLAQASATYGANNRHMKDIETQIAALDKQIRVEMGEIVKRAHADMELAEQTEAEIKRRFSGQQEEASKLNEKTVEFAVLSQEAGSQKKLYEDLYTKLQEANVSAGIKATNITTVDPARAQSMPVRPKLSSNLALGLLFGVLGGLFLAFTVDSLDRTVVSPLEVEEITGMPVIGIIPTFGDRVNAYGAKKIYGGRSRKKKTANGEHSVPDAIWMLDHPESIAAEGFRSLRTSILLSRPGGGPRVILVTSCIPGEGKSTVTANLAVSFAQHGKKVLIMEADMRRPSMKHVMDVSNQTGLSNVLAGSMTLDDAILHGVQVPTLDVLPAGPRPPMPSEMLGSAAFDLLLEQLRSRYDVVLIDSPPALLLTDAVSIASKTDAVVWVARAGAVTRPHLTRAAQMIERSAMPIIGFTLNRMDSSIDPYGYGYGYGYEYRQYGAYYGEENTNEA